MCSSTSPYLAEYSYFHQSALFGRGEFSLLNLGLVEVDMEEVGKQVILQL